MAVSSLVADPTERTARVRNNEVLNRMGKGLKMLYDVKHLRHEHFGHVLRIFKLLKKKSVNLKKKYFYIGYVRLLSKKRYRWKSFAFHKILHCGTSLNVE